MELQINPAQGVSTSEALEAHIRDRLQRISKRFGDRLTRIEVFLADVNGPKGGVNKQCKLEARPRGLDPILAEDLAENTYDSVHQAAERLEKALDKRFGRLMDKGKE